MQSQTALWSHEEPSLGLADTSPVPCAPGVVGAQGERGFWHHSTSGLVLPRGTTIRSRLTDSERDALERSSAARGVQSAIAARKPARAVRTTDSVAALATWAHELGEFDVCGVVTFTDHYAAEHNLRSLGAGCRDVARGLMYDCRFPDRKNSQGYRGQFCLSGEWHRTDREWPHVHLLLNSRQKGTQEAFCGDLWRFFKPTRGRSWFKGFSELTDDEAALFYHLKDTVKGASLPDDPDAFWLKLSRNLHRRGSR